MIKDGDVKDGDDKSNREDKRWGIKMKCISVIVRLVSRRGGSLN